MNRYCTILFFSMIFFTHIQASAAAATQKKSPTSASAKDQWLLVTDGSFIETSLLWKSAKLEVIAQLRAAQVARKKEELLRLRAELAQAETAAQQKQAEAQAHNAEQQKRIDEQNQLRIAIEAQAKEAAARQHELHISAERKAFEENQRLQQQLKADAAKLKAQLQEALGANKELDDKLWDATLDNYTPQHVQEIRDKHNAQLKSLEEQNQRLQKELAAQKKAAKDKESKFKMDMNAGKQLLTCMLDKMNPVLTRTVLMIVNHEKEAQMLKEALSWSSESHASVLKGEIAVHLGAARELRKILPQFGIKQKTKPALLERAFELAAKDAITLAESSNGCEAGTFVPFNFGLGCRLLLNVDERRIITYREDGIQKIFRRAKHVRKTEGQDKVTSMLNLMAVQRKIGKTALQSMDLADALNRVQHTRPAVPAAAAASN